MLHIVICDDDAHMRQRLRRYSQQLAAESSLEMRLYEFSSGIELLESYPSDADIILLDIQMGTLDGMKTAEQIRRFSPDVCIIFITGLVQYALRGYQVHAFSFLPKPVEYVTFYREISSAISRIERNHSHYLLLSVIDCPTRYKVDTGDILYLEVRDHLVTYYLAEKQLTTRQKLNDLEKELAPYGFFRCHASFLVNYRHIVSIGTTQITLANGSKVPISKQKKKGFLEALSNYMGEQL